MSPIRIYSVLSVCYIYKILIKAFDLFVYTPSVVSLLFRVCFHLLMALVVYFYNHVLFVIRI
jgi:hypothetical protein